MLSMSLLTVFQVHAATETYTVDNNKSTVLWKGEKITGSSHQGKINITSGSIYVMNNQLAGGDFTIDMNSLETTDMEADMNAKLTKHLKDDDFFSTDKFPTTTLKITNSTKILNNLDTDPNYEFDGELTIKGITQEIKFEAIVVLEEKSITATAKIIFDRSKFDVKYNSGSFFNDLGDKLIKDEVELKVKLSATLP